MYAVGCPDMERGGRWGPIRAGLRARRHVGVWHDIILQEHPLRDTLVLYLRDGVHLHDILLRNYPGPSSASPYDVGRFPGAVLHKSIPPMSPKFVDDETRALVDRGCVVKMGGRPSPRGAAAASLGYGVVGRNRA